MQGPISPNFRINSTEITAPSNVQWTLPKAWEIDGSGFERLEPFGSCLLTWNYMSFADYTTLRDTWDLISGTATVKLPNVYGNLYDYIDFTGVIVDMPRPDNPYFEGNHANVKMNIRKITITRRIVTP